MTHHPSSRGSPLVKFFNCHILRDHRLIEEHLWIQDGKILNPEKIFFDKKAKADIEINCNGNILSPGLIDIQVNGGWGVDFSTQSGTITEGLRTVAKELVKCGVTSFCPTLVTATPEAYRTILTAEPTEKWHYFANNLGFHLEGPFISHGKRGCHIEENIREFPNGIRDVEAVYGDLSNVRLITLAPELTGSVEVVAELRRRGITVSLGHTEANLEQAEDCVRAGANLVTHLFNAMMSFHHRDPGLLGLLTSRFVTQPVYYGIISDGVHTHPSALRVAYNTAPGGMVLVSDGVFAMGLPDGDHSYFGQTVSVSQGRATIAGTNLLAGSILTLDKCLLHLFKETSCGLVGALEAATLHPALALGIAEKKGTLAVGADADLILLDWDLNVKATYLAGQLIHTA